VRIGHGIGRAHDAGQARDVADLLPHLLVHVGEQCLVGVEDRRHAHRARGFDHPAVLGIASQ
jgi:hypothetical protein